MVATRDHAGHRHQGPQGAVAEANDGHTTTLCPNPVVADGETERGQEAIPVTRRVAAPADTSLPDWAVSGPDSAHRLVLVASVLAALALVALVVTVPELVDRLAPWILGTAAIGALLRVILIVSRVDR